MKILSIYFKNINSLEGESRIDFQQPPFSDTGVFAITGPNGSGKSSILDAITLGLYGETFRFDRPAAHVMTKQTAESFAEVEFAVNQDKYRSSWSVQREAGSPNGELLPAKMQLLKLTGTQELLASNIQQVCQQITEITGMNFRNFTRSILLAQGDFSAFLNALDNERMDILEKIISTDIYNEYKNQAVDNAEAARQRLQELNQDLAVVQIMEPEQREACELDLVDFNEQCFELQQEQNLLKQQQQTLQTITALQAQLADQNQKLQASKTELAGQQQLSGKIVLAQDALPFKGDIEFFKDKTDAYQQGQSALYEFESELKQLQQQLGNQSPPEGLAQLDITGQLQTIDNLKAQVNLLTSQRNSEISLQQALAMQMNEKKSALASVNAWLGEHAKEASLVDDFPQMARLRQLSAELAEFEQEHSAVIKWVKTATNALKNHKSALEKGRSNLLSLNQDLVAQEQQLVSLAQGNNLQELTGLLAEQQERTSAFAELYQLAVANQKQDSSRVGFFGRLFGQKQPEQSAHELSLALEQLLLDIKREENIKLALESLASQQALFKKMTSDRQRLQDGKPCPLCGALEHPYTKALPVMANSQQALADQQAKLKSLLQGKDRLAKRLALAQKNEQQNHAEQNQLIILRSQWLTLCNRLGAGSRELDISNLKLMKQLWDRELDELKEVSSLVNKYKAKQTAIEKLKAGIVQSTAQIEQLQQTIQKLEIELQEHPQNTNFEMVLAAKQLEEKQLSEKIMAQLALLGEKMPAKKKQDALLDRLNARRQEYQSYALRAKAITEELAELTAKDQRCQNEIKTCNDKLDGFGGRLQNEEVAGLHLAVIEKQKLIAEKRQLLVEQQVGLDQLKQVLQGKIQGSVFAGVEEITELLDLLENQSAIVQREQELVSEIAQHSQELQLISQQLDAEREHLKPGVTSHELALELNQAQEQFEIASLEAQRLERLLSDQQQMQKKYESTLMLVQSQREVVQECEAELAKIAAESGNEFRRRVQIQLADRLLAQANAVLEQINGRYYLRQKTSEMGLALEIEDTLQNNARRLPKTLSGGESFVVSLALALGLAELANNGKSVDSLFLDEGFGNLDSETLYTVISTLESLHTEQGKIVGVISHVDSVQKRFKAQLQVVKKPNGRGELKKAS